MLTSTRKRPYCNSAFSYLETPDMNNNKWFGRGRNEVMVVLCDKEILLTEELKTYLLYFSFTIGKNIGHTMTSFSNLPVKDE